MFACSSRMENVKVQNHTGPVFYCVWPSVCLSYIFLYDLLMGNLSYWAETKRGTDVPMDWHIDMCKSLFPQCQATVYKWKIKIQMKDLRYNMITKFCGHIIQSSCKTPVKLCLDQNIFQFSFRYIYMYIHISNKVKNFGWLSYNFHFKVCFKLNLKDKPKLVVNFSLLCIYNICTCTMKKNWSEDQPRDHSNLALTTDNFHTLDHWCWWLKF